MPLLLELGLQLAKSGALQRMQLLDREAQLGRLGPGLPGRVPLAQTHFDQRLSEIAPGSGTPLEGLRQVVGRPARVPQSQMHSGPRIKQAGARSGQLDRLFDQEERLPAAPAAQGEENRQIVEGAYVFLILLQDLAIKLLGVAVL